MHIKLDITKSVYENAAIYYEGAKKTRAKIDRVVEAISETKKEIERIKKEQTISQKNQFQKIKIARKKAWYEKFHYFFTSDGKLAIGGKSADQNDFIYKNYFDERDLFFHADIQGGAVCVLKEGINGHEIELREVAQFAASFSNAWKNKSAAVDVYCVKKSQVSKHAQGGFIQKGAFAILGERTWFRKIPLQLKIGIENGFAIVLPVICKRKIDKEIIIVPGTHEKGKVVKKISNALGVHPDDIQNILPSGEMHYLS
ncbi:MAG: NFACT RNA binding domain-containing protein [Candidatus Micrarchaeota archaeon]